MRRSLRQPAPIVEEAGRAVRQKVKFPAGAYTVFGGVAHFLLSSLQGAILQAKVEGSPVPLKRFIKIAFSTTLQ